MHRHSDYTDAVGFIDSSKKYGSRLGLERIARLCGLAGDPQDNLPVVHVAGTNGKGSISAMIASVLSAAGCKTGLYTSPYIVDVCDCMQIDGKSISRDAFASITAEMKEFANRMAAEGDPPTEFEIETAIAFLWFQRAGCDAAVIEVGLGGRLDATNLLKHSLVSVLSSISLDHMGVLGGTIEEIAAEKCGIIKTGGITVCYPRQPPEALRIIRDAVQKAENPLVIPDVGKINILRSDLYGTDIEYAGLKLHIPFVGKHQVYNAVTAVEAFVALRQWQGYAIPNACIEEGIGSAKMPLRQEVVCRNPVILLDGAHNPDGLAALADTMKTHLAPRRTAVVMGMLADKEYQKSIALIAPLCGRFIASKPASPRALASEAAAECARAYCEDVAVQDDYAEALADAIRYTGAGGAVVVCGSLYLAGPVRNVYFENRADFQCG